jgi:hypothetical protein
VVAIQTAADNTALATAFSAAWQHASMAKDSGARQKFKAAYDARKAEFSPVVPGTQS